MNILNLTLILALLVASVSSNGAPAWYHGEINRVWPHEQGGGFLITYKTSSENPTSLNDCRHKYAYFKTSEIQPEMMRNSYALALAAFHSNAQVGVVIDKSLNGSDCYAMSIDIRK